MKKFKLIAGNCAIESKELAIETAGTLKEIAELWDLDFYYKSSVDKANRTSFKSFRGLGFDEGLRILDEVKSQIGCQVLTDVHDINTIPPTADVVDVLQTPAFLCRQTDFILAAASTGKPVNIKKGQWMGAYAMRHVVEKAKSTGNENIWLCERGNTFGYFDLVVDFLNIPKMQQFAPVIFDATHSAQEPPNGGYSTSGNRYYASLLAKAAMTFNIDGIFLETHPRPWEAKSDGENSIILEEMAGLIQELVMIREIAVGN